MFGPDDARQRLAALRRWPEQCGPDSCYQSDDGSEQFVEIRRAPLDRFPDALDFWLVASGYRSRFDWTPDCRPISHVEFMREFGWLDKAAWVRRDWRPNGDFRAGMMMFAEGLEVQALCVTDREYHLLDWYTTA